MNLIVAVDENWAIGNRNKLLVSIPADMKFFREMTKGNVVVMGRKTMESFPGGQPLKKRTNIVLSRDESYQVKDAVVVHSLVWTYHGWHNFIIIFDFTVWIFRRIFVCQASINLNPKLLCIQSWGGSTI